MKKNNMRKIFAWLLVMIVVVCTAVIGKTALEKINNEADVKEAESLTVSTVYQKNNGLLTVIRDNGDTVFQYEGDFDVWLGADGKTYAVIYLDEGVQQ
ncbi:MAG: hypothetical protein KHX75_12930 [Lachnospiraceae bacterium]|nr:hypothetical protein [Lachnospiraceae bacterium]MBS5469720.1 hypothetical protein [Clostridium sp.]